MKLCILLPTFNNVDTIEGLVAALKPLDYPIVIVNDGSGETMNAVLQRIESQGGIALIHRPGNGGKGAAVTDGIRWAKNNGFTHVLQMDADHQHCVADVPRFVKAATQHPRSLILGKPIFPPNTPRARLNGRKISIVWVWIETLSAEIKDPLFGYRVYPVNETDRTLKWPFIGKRMEFDPEIAVRLVWRGVPVVNLETEVTYHDGGISHFHYFYDNVRISWMHTRLFIGMLLRIGILLARRIIGRRTERQAHS